MVLPGKGYGSYLPLREIMEKCTEGRLYSVGRQVFQFLEKGLFVNGKVIQGLKIIALRNLAEINGIHYTSWESATQIRSAKRIEPSLNDPFVYITEPGKMTGWPEESIKKELGTSFANTEVRLTLIISLDRGYCQLFGIREIAGRTFSTPLDTNRV